MRIGGIVLARLVAGIRCVTTPGTVARGRSPVNPFPVTGFSRNHTVDVLGDLINEMKPFAVNAMLGEAAMQFLLKFRAAWNRCQQCQRHRVRDLKFVDATADVVGESDLDVSMTVSDEIH